jgi:SagB-type dehydrogenase family enzyme
MHAASSLQSEEEVAAWRGGTPQRASPAPSGRLFSLRPLREDERPADPIEAVILRRGSTRRFARESITLAQLSTILEGATQGIDADFLDPLRASAFPTSLNDLYLIVHAVEGLVNGAYIYHREEEALELLKEGDFRAQAGYLGLEQDLPADASADVFLLTDLKPILERFGNRGYRAAQLEAGIMGGKLYLGAYTLGLGASGLTFYDDEVTEFFSPHAQGKSVMFLVALGKAARRRQ